MDNQYEGRTQADMEAMEALGSTFSFDGVTVRNFWFRSFLVKSNVCD
jgi:hypothetical protein